MVKANIIERTDKLIRGEKEFSLFHKGIKNTIPNENIGIEEFLKLIKKDDPLIKEIRDCQNKEKREKLKRKLSYVTIAGTFERRKNDNLIKSSGLACLDFDDIENIEEVKERLKEDEYTHCVFISPSGKGLKLIVKIPEVRDNEGYYGYWSSISKHYNLMKVDVGTKDICRACFLSFDKDPYFNPESKIYTKVRANLLETIDKGIKGEKDNSRSGKEFGIILKLVKKDLSKETIFEEMKMYSKWNEGSKPYKELTYQKALETIKKDKEFKKDEKRKSFLTIRGQLENFWKEQPFFYDRSKMFWLWNEDLFKWELSDEVDFLNSIQKSLGVETLDTKTRVQLIEGFKQIGRQNLPKEPKKSWVQFKNMIYDVKTGEEFEATPEYFVTNPIPWEVGESEETPTMDKLIVEWVGEEYKKGLYEFLAYNTCMDKFMQRIFAFCGGGSNGKGTFIKLNYKFLGEDNCVSSEIKSLSEDRFEPAVLYRKLLCVMGEVSHSDLKNTNQIKKIAGEDKLSFQFKGKTPFTAENTCTGVCLTNSLPRTPDKSLGFYRKWNIIDFPNQFNKVKEDLIGSIPDIEFNNLAKKCIRILKELYTKLEFDKEGNFEERENRYEERSNPVMRYFEKYYDEEVGGHITLREFTNKCNEHLKTNHLRVMSATQVGKVLRDEGFSVGPRKIDGGSDVVILNIQPKTIQTIKTIVNPTSCSPKETSKKMDGFDGSNSSQRDLKIDGTIEIVKIRGLDEK